jgi:hypothetical protein
MRFPTSNDGGQASRLAGATLFASVLLGVAAHAVPTAAPVRQDPAPNLALFIQAVSGDPDISRSALDEIARSWKDGYTPMFLELLRIVPPSVPWTILDFLQDRTGQEFGLDMNAWLRWSWTLPYEPHPDYRLFKGALYAQIDPRMMNFFRTEGPERIRLDEILWGGVPVNGIPPLDHPAHVPASEAEYLEDDHVVFGISIDGEARAYPKRILAWHEMAADRIGGVELTIIYCTLCGTVLPYESVVGGELRRFGTSGLLYRSNKLFFDEATGSLWSTLEGRPVVGPLVGEDLRLRLRSSVTTTWGEWRRTHPDTTVLSIETGFDRDYSEGAAYRDYFSTDALMFDVPATDDRLRNKDEVVVMRLTSESGSTEPLPVAISTALLDQNRVFPLEVAGHSLVVITSDAGANRVYDAGEVGFSRTAEADSIVDQRGRRWVAAEDGLILEEDQAIRLERVTANRAFWFGWYAQFPDTVLVR